MHNTWIVLNIDQFHFNPIQRIDNTYGVNLPLIAWDQLNMIICFPIDYITWYQNILTIILYFKHDNVTMHNTFMCNWSKNASCDDALLISLCIHVVIIDKVQCLMKWLHWVFKSRISKIALGLLIEPLWRSTSHGIMWHTELRSIVEKNNVV